MGQTNVFSRAMYADETTYGTPVTVTDELSRLQSISFEENNNFIYERGLGEGLNVVKTYYGQYSCLYTGGINVNDFDFFQFFVGPKTGSGMVGTPYILTEATVGEMNTADSLYSFTLEAANTTESTSDVQTMEGCVGNEFSLTGSLGSIVSSTFGGFGELIRNGTSATAYTAVTEDSYVMINGVWSWGSSPSSLSGIRTFTINYTNGMEQDSYRISSSRFVQRPSLVGARGYTGSITLVTAQSLANTLYTSFYGQAPASGPSDGSSLVTPTTNLEFKVELINGSKVANIWLDQCSIDTISRPSDVGETGLKEITISFTAKYGKDKYPIRWWTV